MMIPFPGRFHDMAADGMDCIRLINYEPQSITDEMFKFFLIGWLVGYFVLKRLNYFGSLNAELSYFSFVWIYGISTILGYVMSNPFLYI